MLDVATQVRQYLEATAPELELEEIFIKAVGSPPVQPIEPRVQGLPASLQQLYSMSDRDSSELSLKGDEAFVDIRATTRGVRSRPFRSHLVPALATMAIVGVAIVALWPNRDSEFSDPASSESVAESFMEAWARLDGDAVAEMFSSDGTFDMFTVQVARNASGSALTKVESLPALHQWFHALGYEFHNEGCQVLSRDLPPGYWVPDVFCPYTFENSLTRAFGREPVASYFFLTIDDLQIGSAGDQLHLDAYADIWYFFSEWVTTNHPMRFEQMFFSRTSLTPRLDPASITLWSHSVDEFVASAEALPPLSTDELTSAEYGAQARQICAAAFTSFTSVLAGLGPPSPYLGYDAVAHEAAARISEEALAELRALPQPVNDRPRLERLFLLMEQEIAVDRQLATAASVGDTALVDELMRERIGLTHQKDSMGGRDFWNCPVSLGA